MINDNCCSFRDNCVGIVYIYKAISLLCDKLLSFEAIYMPIRFYVHKVK